MALSISNTGLELIKKYEGCELSAYQDSVGIWTIGYGHTAGVQSGQIITQAQADAYLRSDCSAAEKAVNSYDSKYKWSQNQFDALVSFTFNCGSGNLKNLLQSGTRTIAQISAKIPAYNKAGGKVLAGLTKRRASEKALFDQGGFDFNPSVNVEHYPGVFPALPPRGYYQLYDGMTTLKNYLTQIKRIQSFLNWAIGSKLSEDGKYGEKTCTAVKEFQKDNGFPVKEQDGKFGPKTLAKAKTVTK